MKTKIELKRTNGDVIFSHECENNGVAKTIDAFRISGKEFDLNDADLRNAYLRYADLQNAYLRYADLQNAYLRYADLQNAYLSNADLQNAYLSGADLRNANLSGANLSGADLSGANLRNANLSGANLSGADLSGADLWNADLSGANLRNANFRNANLSCANLSNIDVSAMTAFFLPQCPSEGSFVAWKKAGDMIVKLLVTEDAMRSSATTLKCRCSKAKVLAIENIDGSESELQEVASSYDENFVYRVGETVEVDDFDDDRWNECSSGIHFFMAREMAVKY
jgi:hypothetical protein